MTLIAKGLYSAVTQNLCYVDTLRDVALIRTQNSLCFLSISAIEIHLLVDTDTNFPTKMQKRDNPSNRFPSTSLNLLLLLSRIWVIF